MPWMKAEDFLRSAEAQFPRASQPGEVPGWEFSHISGSLQVAQFDYISVLQGTPAPDSRRHAAGTPHTHTHPSDLLWEIKVSYRVSHRVKGWLNDSSPQRAR